MKITYSKNRAHAMSGRNPIDNMVKALSISPCINNNGRNQVARECEVVLVQRKSSARMRKPKHVECLCSMLVQAKR